MKIEDLSRLKESGIGKYFFVLTYQRLLIQGVSKKRNTFDREYLKDDWTKLILLLAYYSVLPYNSVKLDFAFLQWYYTYTLKLNIFAPESHRKLKLGLTELYGNTE